MAIKLQVAIMVSAVLISCAETTNLPSEQTLATSITCGDQTYPNPPANIACCQSSGDFYLVDSQICCGNQVYNKATNGCCKWTNCKYSDVNATVMNNEDACNVGKQAFNGCTVSFQAGTCC